MAGGAALGNGESEYASAECIVAESWSFWSLPFTEPLRASTSIFLGFFAFFVGAINSSPSPASLSPNLRFLIGSASCTVSEVAVVSGASFAYLSFSPNLFQAGTCCASGWTGAIVVNRGKWSRSIHAMPHFQDGTDVQMAIHN